MELLKASGRGPGDAARRYARRRPGRTARRCRPAPAGRLTSCAATMRSGRPSSAHCTTSYSWTAWPPPVIWSPAHPEFRAVTPDGDVVGAYAAAGGSTKAQSYIEVQAAVDEARSQRSSPSTRLNTLQAQLAAARDEVAARKDTVAAADAGRKAPTRRATLPPGNSPSSARRPGPRGPRPIVLAAARSKTEAARDEGLAGLTELEERLRLAEASPLDDDPSTEERDELASLVPAGSTERDGGPARGPDRRRAGRRAGRPGRRAAPPGRRRTRGPGARGRPESGKGPRRGNRDAGRRGRVEGVVADIGHHRGRRRAPGRDRGGAVHA